MAKSSVKKLSEFFDTAEYDREITHTEDVLDIPLQFEAVKWMHGMNGDYAIITAVRLDNGEELAVSTGATMVLDVLHSAERKHYFPFQAEFHREPGQRLIKLRDLGD